MVEVTEDMKLENGVAIPRTFKAITKNPAISCKVSRGTYEHDRSAYALTWIFPSRKCEENRCDFKGSYCYVIFIKSTVYVYRSTFSTVICTFLGERTGGRLLNIFSSRRGAYSNGGAYLKLGANSSTCGK